MNIPLNKGEKVVGLCQLPVDRSTGKKEVLVVVTDLGRVLHLVWMPLETLNGRYKLYEPEVALKGEAETIR